MTIQELDYAFPFVVFTYGMIITFIFANPTLTELAEEKLPSQVWAQFQAKRPLGLVCLVIGGLWSLQNLWLGA